MNMKSKSVQRLFTAALLAGLIQTAVAGPFPGGDIPLATDKGPITLSELRGKTVYLDFWASWCGPCRKSFPWMNRMHQKYAGEGLTIVAVNVDSDRDQAEHFLQQVPAEFRIAFDPEGKLAEAVEVQAMPSSYLIAADGTLIKRHLGFKSGETDKYEAAIRDALNTTRRASRD